VVTRVTGIRQRDNRDLTPTTGDSLFGVGLTTGDSPFGMGLTPGDSPFGMGLRENNHQHRPAPKTRTDYVLGSVSSPIHHFSDSFQ
jgi:hypothetical protein